MTSKLDLVKKLPALLAAWGQNIYMACNWHKDLTVNTSAQILSDKCQPVTGVYSIGNAYLGEDGLQAKLPTQRIGFASSFTIYDEKDLVIIPVSVYPNMSKREGTQWATAKQPPQAATSTLPETHAVIESMMRRDCGKLYVYVVATVFYGLGTNAQKASYKLYPKRGDMAAILQHVKYPDVFSETRLQSLVKIAFQLDDSPVDVDGMNLPPAKQPTKGAALIDQVDLTKDNDVLYRKGADGKLHPVIVIDGDNVPPVRNNLQRVQQPQPQRKAVYMELQDDGQWRHVRTDPILPERGVVSSQQTQAFKNQGAVKLQNIQPPKHNKEGFGENYVHVPRKAVPDAGSRVSQRNKHTSSSPSQHERYVREDVVTQEFARTDEYRTISNQKRYVYVDQHGDKYIRKNNQFLLLAQKVVPI